MESHDLIEILIDDMKGALNLHCESMKTKGLCVHAAISTWQESIFFYEISLSLHEKFPKITNCMNKVQLKYGYMIRSAFAMNAN